MSHKKKILLVWTLFLAIALLLGVFAFLVSTGSFSIDSFHTGTSGEKGSTASYTFRSTTTYQQPGNKQSSTASYSFNLGWLSLGSLSILSTTISPLAVVNGSNVVLSISASNERDLWASITKPDSSIENVTLTNNANTNFTNTTLLGRYNITFYADDSSGAVINNTPDFFESFVPLIFNFTVIDFSVSGINSSWDLLFRDTIIASSEETTGNHSITIPNSLADLKFKSFTEKLQVTLEDINVSFENGKNFGMDKHTSISEFLVTYGINNSYNFTNATVRIFYDDLGFSDENNLQLHKCDNYNFTGRSCSDPFSDITSSATQNTVSDYFEIEVTSFSGFGIKEVTPPTSTGGGAASTGGGGGCLVGYTFDTETRKCVETAIPGQLFDITLSLDDNLIQSSDELSVVVTFESFGTEPTPVNLTFIILDESGNEIYSEEDSITVTTEEVMRKSFKGLDLPNGKYTFVLNTLYNVDVFDEFRQNFEIGEERSRIKKIINWIAGGGKWYLIGLVGVLGIIGLIWYLVRRNKRKINERHGKEPRSFRGKVSKILDEGRIKGGEK